MIKDWVFIDLFQFAFFSKKTEGTIFNILAQVMIGYDNLLFFITNVSIY